MDRLSTVGLALVLAAGPAVVQARSKGPEGAPEPAEITNFLLGPDLAQWLVGPIYQMATPEERAEYLTLTSDAAAETFIESFWERRGPHRRFPPAGTRFVFEDRLEEADVLYREGPRIGHRTDRGTLYVLYGPPAEVAFEASPRPGEEPLEIWRYPADAPAGLDGQRPKALYTFRTVDGATVLFNAPLGGRRPGAVRPVVEVISPSPYAPLDAGATVWLEWEATVDLEALGAEEWEAFLSLDGGRYYGARLTPHLDLSIRRFPVELPGLVSDDARLLLRFGDERREWEVEVPGRYRLLPDPLPARWPALGGRSGEAARPGEAEVALWVEGSRTGRGLTRRRSTDGQGLRSGSSARSAGLPAWLVAPRPRPRQAAEGPDEPSARAIPRDVATAAEVVLASRSLNVRSRTQRTNE